MIRDYIRGLAPGDIVYPSKLLHVFQEEDVVFELAKLVVDRILTAVYRLEGTDTWESDPLVFLGTDAKAIYVGFRRT